MGDVHKGKVEIYVGVLYRPLAYYYKRPTVGTALKKVGQMGDFNYRNVGRKRYLHAPPTTKN